MIDIRLPNITATTERGQLEQIRSYLYQFAQQLNYELSNIDHKAIEATKRVEATTQQKNAVEQAQATFSEVKSLIIKSADIVNAYYEEINRRLDGVYVAESDFGIYAEQTSQEIQATSKSIEQVYTDLQQIIDDVEGVVHSQIEVNAHIKTGLLYYADDGTPVYGLEIGQRTEVDGEEVFDKFARFTADKLSFYDQNGNEVAYISDRKLYITHIEVIGSFAQGGFVDTTLADGSIVTRWMRGEN